MKDKDTLRAGFGYGLGSRNDQKNPVTKSDLVEIKQSRNEGHSYSRFAYKDREEQMANHESG